MTRKNSSRQAAEDVLREKGGEPPESLKALSPREAMRMLHELQVHQIELEMQNEELQRARAALEESQSRYFELYDLAPVAYVTLDDQGRILEVNRAAELLLGAASDAVIMSPISSFVAQDSQDTLYLHQNRLRVGRDPQSCELRMIRHDGETFWASLECSVKEAADGVLIGHAVLRDLTEQKRSHDALAASADLTSSLIRSMQDGFSVLDTKGVAMDANPALCAMTGFSREELVGTCPPHPYWPPEEYPVIQAALEEAMNGPTSDFELIFMRKGGQRFPVMVSAFAVLDRNGETISYAATVRNVTLQKQAEEALRNWNQLLEQRVGERTAQLNQSESRFRQLAEATFEGIVIVEEGVVIDCNAQFAAIYACDPAGIVGCPVMDLVAPEFKPLVAENVRRGVETSYEFIGLRKDGTRIPMEAHVRIFDWQGKATRVIAVRDLAAQKQVAAQLQAQQTTLDQSLRLAMVSEISAGIVHQISQPLTAIMLNLANAGNPHDACEEKGCDCRKVLGDVQSEVTRMMEITTCLRALGNPEKPRRLPMDFNEMVSEQILQALPQAQERGIILQLTTDDSIRPLHGDAVQLAQVVNNLIRNAFDACQDVPEGRRSVEVTTRSTPKGKIELRVTDQGVGIAPDVMKLLFTPFFTTKSDGFGVGLRLSKTIVQAHGGDIKVLGNPDGIGATFRVILPVDPAK